jgi:phosphatidylserine/phosphatidylglycerophosphate/cardiolipin synthase-like enzyme
MFKSSLYDESTFYPQFVEDLLHASREVVIESPFITIERMKKLFPVFEKLVRRNIDVYVFTRDPKEHSETYEVQSEAEIQRFEELGVQVLLCTGNHHRKLAIIDRKILWEGSLNILSQIKSREIMRRIDDKRTTQHTLNFLKLERFL